MPLPGKKTNVLPFPQPSKPAVPKVDTSKAPIGAKGGSSRPDGITDLKMGHSGSVVLGIQKTLNNLGVKTPKTGVFDRDTAASVAAFQVKAGVKPTGTVNQDVRSVLRDLGRDPSKNVKPQWAVGDQKPKTTGSGRRTYSGHIPAKEDAPKADAPRDTPKDETPAPPALPPASGGDSAPPPEPAAPDRGELQIAPKNLTAGEDVPQGEPADVPVKSSVVGPILGFGLVGVAVYALFRDSKAAKSGVTLQGYDGSPQYENPLLEADDEDEDEED